MTILFLTDEWLDTIFSPFSPFDYTSNVSSLQC